MYPISATQSKLTYFMHHLLRTNLLLGDLVKKTPLKKKSITLNNIMFCFLILFISFCSLFLQSVHLQFNLSFQFYAFDPSLKRFEKVWKGNCVCNDIELFSFTVFVVVCGSFNRL